VGGGKADKKRWEEFEPDGKREKRRETVKQIGKYK
jgi:hypothetical protein